MRHLLPGLLLSLALAACQRDEPPPADGRDRILIEERIGPVTLIPPPGPRRPSPGGTPVPEPATILLLGTGLAAAVLRRRGGPSRFPEASAKVRRHPDR